jgi:hypothetical protein
MLIAFELNVPTRFIFKKHMATQFEAHKTVVCSQLHEPGNDRKSYTSDIWTAQDQNLSYVCFTVHFIDPVLRKEQLDPVLRKVRENAKKLRSSPKQSQIFTELVKAIFPDLLSKQTHEPVKPDLDVKTRWNSSANMIAASLDYMRDAYSSWKIHLLRNSEDPCETFTEAEIELATLWLRILKP